MASLPITYPKSFYIFGRGISFSISPTIHNTGFKQHCLPYSYSIRESETIDDVADVIGDPGFGGASVTMPHKLHVYKFCHAQTETARIIGAINTLVVSAGGDGNRIITGHNTDWSGLYTIIEQYIVGSGFRPSVGLVIGAGGASRAALYALFRAGVEHIYLFNRTLSAAEKVKADFSTLFKIHVLPYLEDLPRAPGVVIGTIPAETTTEGQFASVFRGKGLCIDMSYKPAYTPLLMAAQKHSAWATVTGVEVLLAQGFEQYRLWTQMEPPKDRIIKAVSERVGQGESFGWYAVA
ncbi:hypothetical protein BJX63DRAFT_438414 [Aspergillus granulosus]|uniref:Uncharacterized protein n=1 Tax=Aspergillus granulosus TaxID=176169 RepID=A0ABR4GTJ0_9EURO